MSRKNKDDELDTQTTFADMNIEGFKWYDPSKKQKGKLKKVRKKVEKDEYRDMVRGWFAAILPYVFIFLLSVGIVGALLYLWLT